MRYIDAHKDEFGVEPICRVLQFAPSTYYAAKSRPRQPVPCPTASWANTSSGSTRRTTGLWGAQGLAPAAPRRRDGRSGPGGADHGRPRSLRRAPGQGQAHHDPRRRSLTGPRPGRSPVRRRRPEPPVARRHHLCLDLVRLLLHQLHHRRLRPAHRRLAGFQVTAHRPGSRRPRDGHLCPPRRRPDPPDPSLRPRRAIFRHSLHRATGRRDRPSLRSDPRGTAYLPAIPVGWNRRDPREFTRYGGMMLAFGDAFSYRCCGDR